MKLKSTSTDVKLIRESSGNYVDDLLKTVDTMAITMQWNIEGERQIYWDWSHFDERGQVGKWNKHRSRSLTDRCHIRKCIHRTWIGLNVKSPLLWFNCMLESVNMVENYLWQWNCLLKIPFDEKVSGRKFFRWFLRERLPGLLLRLLSKTEWVEAANHQFQQLDSLLYSCMNYFK